MSTVTRIQVNPVKSTKAKRRGGKVRTVKIVRWRVHFANGTYKDRTRQFEDDPLSRIALNEFTALLHRVEANDGTVVLDADYQPVESIATSDPTVEQLLRRYWRARWIRTAGSGRKADRVALKALGAALVDRPDDAPPAYAAYVATVFLLGAEEPDDDELQPIKFKNRTFSGSELATARRWLAQHSLRASQIASHHIQDVLDSLAEGNSASTESRRWTSIRAFLHHAADVKAIDRDLIRSVVVDTTEDGEQPADPDAIPTVADMWDFTKSIGLYDDGRWRALPPLLGGGGLRIGEALALRRRYCRDAECGGMWIDIVASVSQPGKAYTDDGEYQELRNPKGKGRKKVAGRDHRKRTTYLPPAEAAELRRHLATFVDNDPEALLFPSRHGTYMSLAHLSARVWSKASADVFGSGHRLHGRVTRHAFRHLAATRWLNNGVPQMTAVKWGGWRSLSVYQNIYQHFMPNDDAQGVAKMLAAEAVSGDVQRGDERAA